MTATKLMNFADDFANPLGLHPPSPTFQRSSEGRVDSIINSYAMERSPTEQWVNESCVGSYVDDRCPTEWYHPLSPSTPQSPQSFDWTDSRQLPRPLDALNITDESRIVPDNVAARFATRELNALRNDSLTALPQSPIEDGTKSTKSKGLDSTLLRKLFKATIDEKRRVDEARRQTSQDVNAKVTAKAGVEARSRRAPDQLSPNTPNIPDDHEVIRSMRESLDERTQGIGSDQPPPASETESEDAKLRSSQESTRARMSLDRPSSRSSTRRKISLDKTSIVRIVSKNGEETFVDMPLRLSSLSSLTSGKGRPLTVTREEGQVKDSGKRSLDIQSSRINKPTARDARTKQRESGIIDLTDFLRNTGPSEADSPTLGKPKSAKLSKAQPQSQARDHKTQAKDNNTQAKDKRLTAHYEQRRKKHAAAAAEILLSPVEPTVPQWPTDSRPTSSRASGNGLGIVVEEAASIGPSLSKRMSDRARMQATVESARTSPGGLTNVKEEAQFEHASERQSIKIREATSRPTSSHKTSSRPSSSHKPLSISPLEVHSSEKSPLSPSMEDIERAWSQATPPQDDSSSHTFEQIGQAVTLPVLPTATKKSPRHAMPKLALKIPAPGDWEEVSYARSVVYQTLTPVSASKVTIPKSAAGAKSPSIANFPPIPEGFDSDDNEDAEEAVHDQSSEEEDGEHQQEAETTEDATKPPLERKDSKTPSIQSERTWDKPPSHKSGSNWFRDYTSPTLQAFEFQPVDGRCAKSPSTRTPQAASEEIQSIVEGWVEEAHESRSLKLAAARQVMRAPRSPGFPPPSRGPSRPSTSHGFRDRDDEWASISRGSVASPIGDAHERPKTSRGRPSRSPSRRSRSIASNQRSVAVSGHTFDEVGQGVVSGSERRGSAWAAASARSTKVPIKSMSFKSVPTSRGQSRPTSRAQSRAPSVRSPMSPQQEWANTNVMSEAASAQASQGWGKPDDQSVESWPEYEEPDRSSKSSTAEEAQRRPSLASTHRSQKSQGASILSIHSRKSSVASHHSSTTSYPQSIHAESERSYRNSQHSLSNSRNSQHSLLSKKLDEPPVPPLPDSPHPTTPDEPVKRPTTQTTFFAGKGWISPHPLSRSPTEVGSLPQSKIILPSEAFPQGATMTYDEWKQMQEDGLRLRHNHSITESSRTHNGVYQDERYRHPAWEGREHKGEKTGSQPSSSRSSRDSKAPQSAAPGSEAQSSERSGVSFVTGSVKSSRHQRSSSA